MDFLLFESNDDSNQLPEASSEDDDDKTIAGELTEISNKIMDGIKME